jgi:hypothetical protein
VTKHTFKYNYSFPPQTKDNPPSWHPTPFPLKCSAIGPWDAIEPGVLREEQVDPNGSAFQANAHCGLVQIPFGLMDTLAGKY